MSNIVNATATLACTAITGPAETYLWFVETSLANLNAKLAAVLAQLALGQKPTGYFAASEGPSLVMGRWTFPQEIWAFVVVYDGQSNYIVAVDSISKPAGDGW